MPERPLRKFLLAALLAALPLAVQAQGPLPSAGGRSGGSYNPPGAYSVPGTYPASGAYGTPGQEPNYLPSPARSAAVTDPNRKLQPGDTLSFRIEQDREMATLIAVRPSGEVLVEPLDHGVKVAGLTVDAAAAELRQALEKDYYYKATVRLVLDRVDPTTTLGHVFLSGQVNRPGMFPIPSDRTMKLSEVIISSGGFNRFPKDNAVKLTRIVNGVAQVYTVNVKEVIKKSRVDLDMDVKDGDRIVVDESTFKIN